MTERGFHPFAVLHFLRKTILLYLLPLLQVLFARNWAALRTALVQGAVLLAVIAAVSAAVLHTSRKGKGGKAIGTQHRKGQLFAALGRVPQRVCHRQQHIGKRLGLLPGKI